MKRKQSLRTMKKIPSWLGKRLDQAAGEGQFSEQMQYASELARCGLTKKAEAASLCRMRSQRHMCLDSFTHKWRKPIRCWQRGCQVCGPYIRNHRIEKYKALIAVAVLRVENQCHHLGLPVVRQVWDLRTASGDVTPEAARSVSDLAAKLSASIAKQWGLDRTNHAQLLNIDHVGSQFRIRLFYVGPDLGDTIKETWNSMTGGRGSAWLEREKANVYDVMQSYAGSPEACAQAEVVYDGVRQIRSTGALYASETADSKHAGGTTKQAHACPFCGSTNTCAIPGLLRNSEITPEIDAEYPDVYGDRYRERQRQRAA